MLWIGGKEISASFQWAGLVGGVMPTNGQESDWWSSQPQDNDEHCVMIRSAVDVGWHDDTCTDKNSYLCERLFI